MSEDNDDWDKVTEEYDCILDASVTIDNRKTSATPSVQADNNTGNNNTKTLDRSHSETISLATVSLMGSTKDLQSDDLTMEQGDDGASLLPSPQSQPLQIVSVGNETDEYAFTFHEKSLNSVLRKIPPGMKVSVVSVVGAFRTGKSSLLSWFLRYLHLNGRGDFDEDEDESGNCDGDDGDAKKWYETLDSLGNDGFDWRGGAERNTTGIWMWSTPHILPRKNKDGTKENIAVLLVDTQGMFDHETTMGLTTAIFGLSTLLSSYQIYNVDKRIQEDHLQQLAMFSEYGRMALHQNIDTDDIDAKDTKGKDDNNTVPEAIPEDAEDEKSNDKNVKSTVKTTKKSTVNNTDATPFQSIEFLVRDWQNFEDDEDLLACEDEMGAYLDNVLAERAGSDLKATREQIQSCFRNITCYLMVHPGFGVTKKKYTGDIKVVEPIFLAFLDRYCRKVFSNPVPKSIHGRELTAAELGAYIKNYAELFASGAHFPKAATMLEATASANNTNATEISTKTYKEEMDQLAGIKCTYYIQPGDLIESHRSLYEQSESIFDEMAHFGSKKGIERAKIKMVEAINESFDMYSKLNESRNPLAGLETFIIPLTIGFISIALRWIADSTCSSWSQTCRVGSDVFSHVYQVVFFFLLIVSFTKAKQISVVVGRVKKACDVIIGNVTDDVQKEG